MRKITLLLVACVVAFTTFAADMSGIYKVGTTPGADFASLKAATTAINAATITGDVVLEITSDLVEPQNMGLIFNSEFTLTIRPDADEDRTITFDHAADDNSGPSGALCIGIGTSIAWVDITPTRNITIDGYAVGGTTRRLKIATAVTHGGTNPPIVILNDCSNIQIKNCTVHHVGSSTGSSNYGIYVRTNTPYGTAKMPFNITIENNVITCNQNTASQGIGIYANAAPAAPATGIVIKDNVINARTRGLFLNDTESLVFTGNEVRINQTAVGVLSSAIMGNSRISGDVTIDGNKFIGFKSANSTTGAYGIRGILASGGGNWNITNNFFTGFDKTTAGGETMMVGIRCGSTCFIFQNTFYLNALTNKPAFVVNPTDVQGAYTAISIASGTPEIRNNIFVSDEDAVYNYAIRGTVTAGQSDNNIFDFKAGITMASANNVYPVFANYVASGVDANSKIHTVNFADAAAGDLSITGASISDAYLGVPVLASVTKDIFGTTRASMTYAGAHESVLPFGPLVGTSDVESNARIIRTSNGVQVELDGEAIIELYNMNGVLLDKTRMNGSYSRDLDKGIYIIRINGKSTKFIK